MTVAPHGPRSGWRARILAVLVLEKVLQHAIVTWALQFDRFDIRDTTVVDYRLLVISGGIAGALFAVALAGLVRHRSWSLKLLIFLALFDIVGEFVAQGTLSITVTVSFVVAMIILLLARGALRWLR